MVEKTHLHRSATVEFYSSSRKNGIKRSKQILMFNKFHKNKNKIPETHYSNEV